MLMNRLALGSLLLPFCSICCHEVKPADSRIPAQAAVLGNPDDGIDGLDHSNENWAAQEENIAGYET